MPICKLLLRTRRHPLATVFYRTAAAPPPRRDFREKNSLAHPNWLITKLTREGKPDQARALFDGMPTKDVVTWTAMVSGYVRCGHLSQARLLFDHPNSKKNVVTWTALLSGYIRSKNIPQAAALFRFMPEKNTVSWNTMIAGYADNGMLEEARHLFDEMPVRNTVSWNTIISAMAQNGRVDEAYQLFQKMPERDIISWTAMVAGLAQNGRVDEARCLFDEMPERNTVSWNAMVSGYAQNGRLEDALQLFAAMPERDLQSWNAMISGCIQNGELEKARAMFDEMGEKNVVTWTSVMTGYVESGLGEEAFKLFPLMQINGVRPNQATFVTLLAAASDLAGLVEGKQIHQIICKTATQGSPFVQSALIGMYSKCGDLGTANSVFDLAKNRDLVLWNGIIASHAYHGRGKEALALFAAMRRSGQAPDGASFVGILSACSHSGLVEEGFEFFRELVKDGSLEVREDHYACLVDLCGRAGRMQDAAVLIKKLERFTSHSSAIAWGALLAGCNVHGDVRVGKVAAKRLMRVEPNNAGTYMLMSNIYASAGRWKEAARVRFKMKDQQLKKQPGCSWIEVGRRVHVFVARDKSHCDRDAIYSLVKKLHGQMRMPRLEPFTECSAHVSVHVR
ncbi:pentatricopeptide repeat (PPR) superfamily protein [Wolffia australiana]